MTLPAYLAQNGVATSGNGKIFHPDACTKQDPPGYGPDFAHLIGDDYRAWNTGDYGVEGRLVQPFAPPIEQVGWLGGVFGVGVWWGPPAATTTTSTATATTAAAATTTHTHFNPLHFS
jgi:hypothetical protein